MNNDFYTKNRLDYNDFYSQEKIQDFINEYKYCEEYLKNMQSIDTDKLEKVLNICDDLMCSDIIEDIKELNDDFENTAYERLHYLLMNVLSKEVNGKPLGDALIVKSFEDGSLLTAPLIDYDCVKQYQKLGLTNIPKIEYFYRSSSYAAIMNARSFDVCIREPQPLHRIQYNRIPDDARLENLELLRTIRHEMQHVKQYKKYSECPDNDILKRIIDAQKYLENNFSTCPFYGYYHDNFPTEYNADYVAYEETIRDLEVDYKNNYSEYLVNKIEFAKKERISKYPDNPLFEFYKIIFDYVHGNGGRELVDFGGLSEDCGDDSKEIFAHLTEWGVVETRWEKEEKNR